MAMRLTFIAYCFHQEGQSSTYMYVYTTFPENWTLLLHFCALSTSRRITPLYFAHRPSGFFLLSLNPYVTQEMDSKGLSLMSTCKVIKSHDSNESVHVCV